MLPMKNPMNNFTESGLLSRMFSIQYTPQNTLDNIGRRRAGLKPPVNEIPPTTVPTPISPAVSAIRVLKGNFCFRKGMESRAMTIGQV